MLSSSAGELEASKLRMDVAVGDNTTGGIDEGIMVNLYSRIVSETIKMR